MAKNLKHPIPEPEEYLQKRKGGIINLIFTALCLEATRQIEEGFDVISIETAARKAFDVSQGFFTAMEKIGIDKVIEYMHYLSDDSDTGDPLYSVYHNFFSPGPAALEKLDEYRESQDKSMVTWISFNDKNRDADDFMLVDMLKKRFQAVAFMISSDIYGAGIGELKEIDSLCKNYLDWKKGPFLMMNEIGMNDVMQMVTERMQLSHRREINFPIPRCLIEQAQKNAPWLVEKRWN
jgi:3-hydroxyacyl-CoA dehydrogenase